MALHDGWEYATAYDFMLDCVEDGVPIVALPDEDDEDGLAYYSHPVTSDLEAYLFQEDENERARCLAVLIQFAGSHAPGREES